MPSKQWLINLKKDPERYEDHLRRGRERKRKAREDNPEGYQDQLRNDRERLRNTRESDPEGYRENGRKKYASNPEPAKRYRREYYVANREVILERDREYRQSVQDRIAERNHRYYQANQTKLKDQAREWQRANLDKHREVGRRRYIRKLGASGTHTPAQWQALCSYYMDQCLCCGEVPDVLTRDHVVPLSMGGTDDISNIQPLCGPCNSRKHTKIIDYRI